ncbi:cobyrinate a,c-diamide synthase [Gudongella sp. SC589]|jgi:cobyrinic acid a,c-diamide synthase|uniref:cobyrinate a,c-diamide synthase n=1 Tax=Gudongella sp. SC589 TaxID=3385990 RepID=UPI0039047646
MKGFMITAPTSNTGKTTITTGIIRALENRGLLVSPYKTGPDYIDGKFLSMAAGSRAGNLDLHLQGVEGVREAISMGEGDMAVIEGVMGYFDGASNSWENSSYDLSRQLDIPAVLVYTPEGEMFSAIPKIKGMAEFGDSRIRAVILNKTSRKMYEMLKEVIENHTDLAVLGHIPYDEDLRIGSGALGLLEPGSIAGLEKRIEKMASLVEENLDLAKLVELAEDVDILSMDKPERTDLRIAVAMDDAFSFHYRENLRLLESMGRVFCFSPMHDKEIPEADLVLLGGGYPEKYLKELSGNKGMIESIKSYADKGGYILAEGGGMMYLMDTLEGVEMCGLLRGDARMTGRLQRFGYVNIQLEKDCLLGKAGTVIPGNEFHKSVADNTEDAIFKVKKPMGQEGWSCGYKKNNILGYYQHINFAGKRELLSGILDRIGNGGGEDVY